LHLPVYDIVYSDAICRSVKGTSWLQLQGRKGNLNIVQYHTSTLKLAATRSYEMSVHFYDIRGDKSSAVELVGSCQAQHAMDLSCSSLIHNLHTRRLQARQMTDHWRRLVKMPGRTEGHFLFICDTTSCSGQTVVQGVSEW